VPKVAYLLAFTKFFSPIEFPTKELIALAKPSLNA